MNGLSSLNKTYREYSQAATDVLVRFWKPEVEVEVAKSCTLTLGYQESIF